LDESKINFKIVVKSELSELDRIRSVLKDKLHFIELIERNRIVLVVDEILSNIIEHGYKLNPNNLIEIEVEVLNQEKIIIKIYDDAPHFDLSKTSNPNLMEHATEGKPRGLGLFLVRSIVDEIQYQPKYPQGNINILIKKIN